MHSMSVFFYHSCQFLSLIADDFLPFQILQVHTSFDPRAFSAHEVAQMNSECSFRTRGRLPFVVAIKGKRAFATLALASPTEEL